MEAVVDHNTIETTMTKELKEIKEDDKDLNRLTGFLFVGLNGMVRALDVTPKGTKAVWTQKIEGAEMMHTILEPSSGLLYVGTGGRILCYEALTGKQLWKSKIASVGRMTILLLQNKKIIICAVNLVVFAFNAITGSVVWKIKLQHESVVQYSCAIVLLEHHETLFIGTQGCVAALDVKTGGQRWVNTLPIQGTSPVTLAFYSPTSPDKNPALIVGMDGYLITLEGSAGEVLKVINLEWTGYNPVALLVDPEGLLFAAIAGFLFCFKADSLELIWKSNLPGLGYMIPNSLLFGDDNTILIGAFGKVAAVNKTTGATNWQTSLPRCGIFSVSIASTPNSNVVTCGSFGKLYLLTKNDGEVLYTDNLPDMGYAECCLSTSTYNTDFNSTTTPHFSFQ